MSSSTWQNGRDPGSPLPMTQAALRSLRHAIHQAEERAVQAITVSPGSDVHGTPGDMRRLQLMERTAARAIVTAPDGLAIVGSQVVIRDDGRLMTYALSPPGVGGREQPAISVDSPLGGALLGRRAGDIVIVSAPGGERAVELVDVR